MDKVIVLMAAYQGERYLEEQLKSIVAQDYQNLELVVSDDGSSDGTFFLLSLYKKRYPDKITVQRNEKNLGGTKNFLTLLANEAARQKACGGQERIYFMFCDQDDNWHADKVSRTLARMKRLEARYGKDVPALVFTDARVVDGEGNPLASSFFALQHFNMRKRTLSHLLMENMVIGCTCMMNMALAAMVEKVPEHARYHDWWMALLAAATGHTSYLPAATIDYRQHGNNIVGAQNFGTYVKRRAGKLFKQRNTILENFRQAEEFLKLYAEKLPERATVQIQNFLMLQRQNICLRRINALRGRYLKSGLVRNIGLLLIL